MTTAADYRQYAEECLTAMRASVIPEVREALLTSARRWADLADRTERAQDEKPRATAVGGRSASKRVQRQT
jgi:hypothetical protein